MIHNKENALKLYKNRLMSTYEEISAFEEAMESLYNLENIENIKYFCNAFDDRTEEKSVMFSLVHGIENYDNIFGKEMATSKFLDSVEDMALNAPEWLEIMILRILNDNQSRIVFIEQLKNKHYNTKDIIVKIIKNLIQSDFEKFNDSGNEVLNKIK